MLVLCLHLVSGNAILLYIYAIYISFLFAERKEIKGGLHHCKG